MSHYENNKVSHSARAHFGDNYVIGSSIEDEFRKLLYTGYSQRKTKHPARYPETCGWLLSNPQFQHWRTKNTPTPASRLLWVSAPAGCGKSVIAKSMVDDPSWLPGTVKCHFFCATDHGDETDLEMDTKLVGALLHQLLAATDRNDLIHKHAIPLYRKNHASIRHSLDDLWEIFCNVVCQWQEDPLVFILDGLEECEKESRKRLLARIFQLVSYTPKLNLKFLLTSRSGLEIEQILRKCKVDPGSVLLNGINQVDMIGKDINYMIERRVPEILNDFQLPPSENTQRRIVAVLRSSHCGTYLWLQHILSQLQELEPAGALIDNIIRTMPYDLEKVYKRMWDKTCTHSPYKKYAGTLVGAARRGVLPLDILQLKALFSAAHENQFETMSPVEFVRLIRILGGDLIVVTNNTVRLVHMTAQEFLSTLPLNQSS